MSEATPPQYCLTGQKVALGPLRRELLPLHQRWLNDFEASMWLGRPPKPITAEAEAEWFDRMTKGDSDVIFTVYELSTGQPIGNAGLHKIEPVNRTAEFGIGLLEKSCWNKGYGTETTRLVVGYGFRQLGLNSVYLTCFATNEGGLKAYARAGFKLIGRQREASFRDGAFHDIVRMDCLAREFSTSDR